MSAAVARNFELPTPSPGNPGEGWGEGDLEFRKSLDGRNHPHPSPLPDYRERGQEGSPARIRPLRILIALPGLHRVVRGAETAFEEIGRELAHLGHNVTLIGSGKPATKLPYRFLHAPGLPRELFEKWPKFPLLRSNYVYEELSFVPGFLRQFRPGEYDVTVTCSYPFMNWMLRRGGTQRPRHVFVTQNGDWMIRAGNREYRYFGCDGLVCTNAEYFDRHKSRFAAALIPNGVNPAVFFPAAGDRAAYGLPADVPIALMVSALIPSKRVLEGVRAAAAIPNLFLVVAGDGELRGDVQKLADELMPGRFRRITLPRERMPGLYRCADLFLHMSRDEPSANAYMEALSTGLPIVTHDWAVTRWTLEEMAVLVDSGETENVTAGIDRALKLKSSDHTAKCRELIDRRFAWSSIAKSYSNFFENLCRKESTLRNDVSPSISTGKLLDNVGVIAIGRNEGDRLKQSLASVAGKVRSIVYVDSGSTDGSLEAARLLGAQAVSLDTSVPFNAARARNCGFDRLMELSPDLEFVQFIDGDCQIVDGWLDRAVAELKSDEKLAAVCGRRREKFPERSIYNRVTNVEWDTPIGPAKSCGGDSMMRTAALKGVGGFDPTVMAGEEPELCLRLRKAGWKILRVNAEMTRHDAAMTRFSQWWKRQVRGGYGAADVARRFGASDGLFVSQVKSAKTWSLYFPAGVVAGWIIASAITGWAPGFAVGLLLLLAWPGQVFRMTLASMRKNRSFCDSLSWAALTMLAKWPNLIGQWKYARDRAAGRRAGLIEYKAATP